MKEGYHIRSSEDLYAEGPSAWMFKPYYVAIKHKEKLAGHILGKELDKHYMKQDGEVVNVQYRARSFNSELKSEMDTAVRNMGIIDPNKMWEEMDAATAKILEKHMKRRDGLWLRFMRRVILMTK